MYCGTTLSVSQKATLKCSSLRTGRSTPSSGILLQRKGLLHSQNYIGRLYKFPLSPWQRITFCNLLYLISTSQTRALWNSTPLALALSSKYIPNSCALNLHEFSLHWQPIWHIYIQLDVKAQKVLPSANVSRAKKIRGLPLNDFATLLPPRAPVPM